MRHLFPIIAAGCILTFVLGACDRTDTSTPSAPSASESSSGTEQSFDDETTRAEALAEIDPRGPSSARVTWNVDADVPREAVETVQHAFVLVQLGRAEGSTPRPDLVSGLFQPGNDAGLAIVEARARLIDGDETAGLSGAVRVRLSESVEFDDRIVACVDYSKASRDGDPVESQVLNYFLDDVQDSDGSRVPKITKFNAGPTLADSPRADERRCADWLAG